MKKKTLIIDFDTYNKSISVLYNTFIKEIDYNNIKNNVIEYSEYEHLLYMEDVFLEDRNVFEIVKSLKTEYDQILIDTPGDLKNSTMGRILEMSDDVVFVIVPSICDLKKAINYYEILRMDFKVPEERIKFFINKDSNYSIDNLIIQKMFGIKKIAGSMRYSDSIESNINGKIKKKFNLE